MFCVFSEFGEVLFGGAVVDPCVYLGYLCVDAVIG